ncbi:MAG: hypothetical protein JRI23_06725 [Deltaproteobacteria bacterium]|jgi:hypothetical protein|nr:hypothetical protein [Deltaproteobacteria bacterium]MBW2531281.1 hypothetical protein [Deltaproteobacteria bacterium]
MPVRLCAAFAAATTVLVSLGCDGAGPPGDGESDHLTEAQLICASSLDCDDAERCFEGRCVVELCDDSNPCSAGGACLDGACCYSDAECDLCDSEDCYETGGACATSADCLDDERCYEGACVPILCDDATPCAPDGVCIDGACCYPDESCSPCDSEDCW